MSKSEITRGQILYRLALSVVLSGAILLIVGMFSPLIGAVYYAMNITLPAFFVSLGTLAVMLWLAFSALGYSVGGKGMISYGRFSVLFIPSALFWAFYSLIRNAIPFIPSSSNSVILLGYIFSGRALKAVSEASRQPISVFYWLISLVVHIIFAASLSYLFYRLGIKKREQFRQEILSGEESDPKPKKPLALRLWFIPVANLIPFFPWVFKYYAYPEYKLRYFIPRFVLIIAVFFGLNYSRTLFYRLTETLWLNIVYQVFTYYLLGLITSLIVLWDDKKNGERRGQTY